MVGLLLLEVLQDLAVLAVVVLSIMPQDQALRVRVLVVVALPALRQVAAAVAVLLGAALRVKQPALADAVDTERIHQLQGLGNIGALVAVVQLVALLEMGA